MSALLSTFGIDWRLLTAQAVNFVVLAFALTWLLYKPVLKMVRERERVVARGVEDAERASEKLARADAEVSERVSAADKKAEEILRAARARAEAAQDELLKDARARAAAVVTDAHARAKESAAKMLRESEREIARLSLLGAERVLQHKND